VQTRSGTANARHFDQSHADVQTQYDCSDLNAKEATGECLAEYEAKVAALERKVGRLTLKLDLLKKV
jgi:hypothetical protein